MNALRNGTMIKCTITPDDVKRFVSVYGKVAAEVKGKMTRPTNSNFKQIITIKATDKCLTLHSDILFANNIPFMITVAKPLNLLLCSEIGGSRSSNNVSNIIVSHIMILKSQGFHC